MIIFVDSRIPLGVAVGVKVNGAWISMEENLSQHLNYTVSHGLSEAAARQVLNNYELPVQEKRSQP